MSIDDDVNNDMSSDLYDAAATPQVPGLDDRGWRTWELHVPTDAVPVADALALAGRAVVASLDAESTTPWFFLRYWQGGWHVRLRVAGLDQDAARWATGALDEATREVAAGVPAELLLDERDYRQRCEVLARAGETDGPMSLAPWRAPGAHPGSYPPEYDRYGGAATYALNEHLFALSSEAVCDLLATAPPTTVRAGFALQATCALLQAVVPEQFAELLREWLLRWMAWVDTVQAGSGERALAAASSRAEALAALPAGRMLAQGAAPAALQPWLAAFRAATQQGLGSGPQAVVFSHLHMLHNRLGLGLSAELASLGTALYLRDALSAAA
jgi:hypothetical protein